VLIAWFAEGIDRTNGIVLNSSISIVFQREAPPAQPRRALVLSNQATSDGYARTIASACAPTIVRLMSSAVFTAIQPTRPEALADAISSLRRDVPHWKAWPSAAASFSQTLSAVVRW
jgi:hypothetical protein